MTKANYIDRIFSARNIFHDIIDNGGSKSHAHSYVFGYIFAVESMAIHDVDITLDEWDDLQEIMQGLRNYLDKETIGD